MQHFESSTDTMKLLLILLRLCTIFTVHAQEIDSKKNFPKQDIVYVLQLDNEKLELPYSVSILDSLNPEMIESMNVIKKTSSAEFVNYVSKDRKGIVIIKLLDAEESQLFFDAIKEKSDLEIIPLLKESQENEKKVRLRGKSDNSSILIQIIIDDKTFDLDSSRECLDDIKSIDMIKDEEGLKKYDAFNKDGVIVIKLKENLSPKLYQKS